MRAWLHLLLPLVLLAGCGRTVVNAPGLGPRPIEAQSVPAPDDAAEPETAATPALATKLAAIALDAEGAHAAFESERRAGSAIIARGRTAPEGGEAWIARQQAISALAARQAALRENGGGGRRAARRSCLCRRGRSRGDRYRGCTDRGTRRNRTRRDGVILRRGPD